MLVRFVLLMILVSLLLVADDRFFGSVIAIRRVLNVFGTIFVSGMPSVIDWVFSVFFLIISVLLLRSIFLVIFM